MRAIDSQYKDIYRFINQHGLDKGDRTGVGTLSALAGWMRHDLRDNRLPITSLRVIRPEKFIHEMLWFVSGSSSIKYLKDNNVSIWDSWFMPGTDKYEEPVHYTVDELSDMYVDAHGVLPFTALFQSVPAKPSFEELQSALILSGIPKHYWQTVIEEEFSGKEYPADPQDLDIKVKNGALKITMSRFQARLLGCWIMKDLDCGYINQKVGCKALTLQERLDLIPKDDVEKWDQINEIAYSVLYDKVNDGDEPEIISVFRNGSVEPKGISNAKRRGIGKLLTELDVPAEITIPAVKPVSLQTRLNRVSKNDKEKWAKINAVIDEPWEGLAENATGKSILEAGELVKIEIFKDGKFQKVEVRSIVAACLGITLTELGISQYKLIDADIGKGAYGPQWRHYQDVQIVDDCDVAKFDEQGYEFKCHVDIGRDGIVRSVMHREIDQLQNAIDMLKKDPDSRRIYVTSCNPGTNWQAALEPCHLYFQFISHEKDLRDFEEDFAKLDLTGEYIDAFKDSDLSHGDEDRDDNEFLKLAKEFAASKGVPTRWLSIAVVLRSWDAGGGAVFNTPQYAVLTRMVAEVVGMEAREMFIMGVDSHIYENQKELVDEVIYTDYQNDNPQLHITRKVTSIDDFKIDDFVVTGYDPVPNTKVMPIAR